MDAADLAEDGGRPGCVGPSDPRRSADRAFGGAGFFAAYLELVGSRATDPEEAGRVVERLEAAPSRPLSEPDAPRRPGLYALYLQHRARPVYVGKAGGQRGVQGRLADHLETLRLHRNVDPADVQCRFVLYGRRAPLAYLESILIRHFRPEWNRLIGFGSGRSRKGLPPIGSWEQRYPRKAAEAAARRPASGMHRAAEERAPYATDAAEDLERR